MKVVFLDFTKYKESVIKWASMQTVMVLCSIYCALINDVSRVAIIGLVLCCFLILNVKRLRGISDITRGEFYVYQANDILTIVTPSYRWRFRWAGSRGGDEVAVAFLSKGYFVRG